MPAPQDPRAELVELCRRGLQWLPEVPPVGADAPPLRPAAVLVLFGVLDSVPAHASGPVARDLDVLLLRRAATLASHAGQIAFPGGKIDPDEAHADALKREIREELDAEVAVGELVFTTEHAYDDRTIALYFYRCALNGTPRPLLGQEMRWVPREELPALGLPPADKALIELLTSGGR